MFSAGSVFTTLGARVSPEGFNQYARLVADAKSHHIADVRLAAAVMPEGFDRYARLIRMAEGQTREFAGSAEKSMGSVSQSMTAMAGEGATAFSRLEAGLGTLRNEFMTVGEAAQHSAATQKAAMTEMQANMVRTEEVAAGMSGKMGSAGEKAGASFASQFGKAANLGRWAVLGAGITGAVSLKWAGDFQKNMELLRTEAHDSQSQVDLLHQKVLDLAPAVGIGPNKLAEGLYHIASAGIGAGKGVAGAAQQFNVLKVAAQGARIGNADLQDTAKALGAIVETAPKDIQRGAAGVQEAMGVLIKIVGGGNMRMRDLIAAMGSGIVPAAKSVGLGLRDVGTALDVLTSRGVPAEQAATRLRTTLALMSDPTHKAQQALAQLGLSHDAIAKAFRGNADAMDRLHLSHEKLREAFSHGGLIGGLETIQASLDKTFPKGRALTQDEYTAAIGRFTRQLDAMGVSGAARDKQMDAFKSRLKETGTAAIQQSQLITDAFGGARMGTTMEILMQNLGDAKKRMGEIGSTSQDAQKGFQDAVTAYSHTFNFQMQQLGAGVQKVGIQLGEALIPFVESAAHAFEQVASFIGKHEALAKALAITIGVGLLGAVAAFFQKMFLGFKDSMTQLVRYMTQWDKLKGTSKAVSESVVSDNAAQAAAIERVTAALVVEAEQLGIVQAEMGKLAATGEAVTATGIVLPRGGVGRNPALKDSAGRVMSGEEALATETRMAAGFAPTGITALEEPAVAKGGLGSRLMGGAKTVAGRAGSGLMLGLVGTSVAQLAGGVIGGKAGSAVSGIGTAAATGAGLGMLLGPEGALAGGVVGGLVGAFHHFLGGHQAESYGKQIADQVHGGMGVINLPVSAPTQKHVEAVIKTAGDRIQEAQKKLKPTSTVQVEGPHGGAVVVPTEISPADRRKLEASIQAEYDKIGRAAAVAFNDGMQHGPKFQTAGTFFHSMTAMLRTLPDQSKEAATKSMLITAAQLEDEGRLPKGAMQHLIDDLGAKFGTLGPNLRDMARHAMDLINTEIQQNKVVDSTKNLVDDIGKTFADAPKVGKVTAHNVTKVWLDEMEFLKTHMHDKNAQSAADAKKLWNQIHTDASHYAALMHKNVGASFDALAQQVSGDLGAVATAADSASASVTDSANTIGKQVNHLAQALHIQGIHFTPAKTPAAQHSQLQAFGQLPSYTQLGGGLATGGIPNPFGGAADDHILVDPMGRAVAAMSGTEGVLNTPQMGITDVALRVANMIAPDVVPYSGLAEMWGSGLRHYATGGPLSRKNTGGYVNPFGSSYTTGRIDQGVDFNMPVGAPIRAIGDGIVQGIIPNWYSGQPLLWYELTSGPQRGRNVFVAEQITGLAKKGTHLHKGDPVARYAASGTGIEMGWATPTGQTEAMATSGYHEGQVTPAGQSFMHFIQGLGVRGGGSGNVPVGYGASASMGAGANVPTIHGGKAKGDWAFKEIAAKAIHHMTNQANQYFSDAAGGAGGTGASVTVGAIKGQTDFAHNLLKNLGIHESAGAIQSIVAWEKQEGGHWNNSARFNPLNTTMPEPGSRTFQSVGPGATGIRIYNSWAQGIKATVETLRNYPGILRALRSGNFGSFKAAVNASPWGTHFAGGGLLRRLAGGGTPGGVKIKSHHNPNTRLETGPQGLHPSTGTSTGTKKTTHKAPVARKGKQVLPHSLLKLTKVEDVNPLLGQIDEADRAIKDGDTKYGEDETYFNIVDSTLSEGDLGTLKDLRHKQFTQLTAEKGLDDQAEAALTGMGHFNTLHVALVKQEAGKVAKQIAATKKQLTDEGRRISSLRHHRADKMIMMADNLARKVSAEADKRTALTKRKKKIQEDYANRISALSRRAPGSIGDQLKAIDADTKRQISAHPLMGQRQKNAIHAAGQRKKNALTSAHNQRVHGHSTAMKDLRDARRGALKPVDDELTKAITTTRHLQEDEAHHRRKYEKQGWDKAWNMQLHRYKLQDRLKDLQAEEKTMTGSTTEVGSGGILKQLVDEGTGIATAKSDLDTKIAETPADIVNSALNQLTLAGQQAQASANTLNTQRDISDFIPADIIPTLQGMGITNGDIHRIYYPDGTQLDNTTGQPVDTTGTDTSATGTASVADIAAAAMAQVAAMDAASSQIYQQFGSNFVAPQALPSAVSRGTFGPGVSYFGAMGPALNESFGLGPTGASPQPAPQTFNQTNHYAIGPSDPHLHAQASRVQFEYAFG